MSNLRDSLAVDVRAHIEQLDAAGLLLTRARTPAEARESQAATKAALAPGPDLEVVRDFEVPTRGGMVKTREFIAQPAHSTSTMLYLHGGGWVSGDVDVFDPFLRSLASRTGCRVLAPEYRLAPEHPFPAAASDCWDVLKWLAGPEGGPSGPVIVCGDSSGGNLAAVVTRKARDHRGPTIALSVLICPVLDHDFTRSSYEDFAEGFGLTRASMMGYWDYYVPDVADRDSPDASPLRAADLAGIAPTLIVVASHDPLRDEGQAYAGALAAAGVPVTCWTRPGVIHGWYLMAGILGVSQESFVADLARAIRHAVAN